MAQARIVVQLLDGDTVVHEFVRGTSQPTAESVQKMLGAAMGWMQAYQGALNEGQWQADVRRAREVQP